MSAPSSSPLPAPSNLKDLLFNSVQPHRRPAHRKVTIVGAGAVGIACGYSIVNQGHASELVILDIPAVEAKVKGEVADLIHGEDAVCTAMPLSSTNTGVSCVVEAMP